MEYRLLEKTELWIKPVTLVDADLCACGRAAASALGLEAGKIMVTDAMGDTLTLDVLVPTIKAEHIVARKQVLLQALDGVRGVGIREDTEVHSGGVLGLISLNEPEGQEVLRRSREMARQIADRIKRRCVVYPTGREVAAGQIRDTNTPFLMKALESEGYEVLKGPILDDDAVAISRAFRDAAAEGYGLLITTGGIGAERKDLTIQALTAVDLGALIPYILKFRRGQGRHHRDGVRIGVGRLHRTTIVCLPGPHDEVELAWPILRQGLQESWDTKALAEGLARVLREKFLARSRPEHGGHGHSEEVDHGIE